MSKSKEKHWLMVIGLILICIGLLLAASSNPRRFSMSPNKDRKIDLLVITGLTCTVAGIGLLLWAIRSMTQPMIADKRAKANLGVGIGFVLQLIGFALLASDAGPVIGLPLVLASLPLLVWGCMRYAEGKRYSKWVGLLGAAGIPGLIILIVLPVSGGQTQQRSVDESSAASSTEDLPAVNRN
jgi:MFS family permease